MEATESLASIYIIFKINALNFGATVITDSFCL